MHSVPLAASPASTFLLDATNHMHCELVVRVLRRLESHQHLIQHNVVQDSHSIRFAQSIGHAPRKHGSFSGAFSSCVARAPRREAPYAWPIAHWSCALPRLARRATAPPARAAA